MSRHTPHHSGLNFDTADCPGFFVKEFQTYKAGKKRLEEWHYECMMRRIEKRIEERKLQNLKKHLDRINKQSPSTDNN